MRTKPFQRRRFFRPRRKPSSGSALLLALLVVFAASFVLAGWAMMLAARSASSEEAVVGQKRRIAYQNARNIGLQWARNGLANNSVTGVTNTRPDNWGQFVAVTSATNLLNTTNVDNNRINLFAPLVSPYTVQVNASLSGPNFTNTNVILFRSRSPLYGGYPLVAQTNTTGAATNFSRVFVATNGLPLMYAQPSSTTAAPASSTYNALTNRTVVTSLGGSTLAPISTYPITPLASEPSGANAYLGTLSAQPPRSLNINGLGAAITTAFGTNAPTINDTMANFRVLGNPAGFSNLTQITHVSGGTTRRFLLVNNIANSTLTAGTGGVLYNFQIQGGPRYEISLDNGWLRFRRTGGNNSGDRIKTLNSGSQYIAITSATGANTNPLGPSDKGTSVNINNPTQLLGFQIPNDQIVGLQDKTAITSPSQKLVTFSNAVGATPATQAAFDATGVVNGAVIYNRDAYGISGGVFFLLMGTPMNTTAFTSLQRLQPDNAFWVRALVNGLPLVQLTPATAYSFQSPSGVNAIGMEPTNSYRFRLRSSADANPLLVHVEQELTGDASLRWRRVLMVNSAANLINVTQNTSAVSFSYLDGGDFDIGVDAANSTRPLYLSIVGANNVNTDTSFSGGANTTWNLGITLRNSNATFIPGGALTLSGGVRSNASVAVTPNTSTLNLQRNTNPGVLDQYADRMGWIETWRE